MPCIASHFFAVSKEGRAFAGGKNDSGQLFLVRNVAEASSFTEIQSLRKCKIKAAHAGVEYLHREYK